MKIKRRYIIELKLKIIKKLNTALKFCDYIIKIYIKSVKIMKFNSFYLNCLNIFKLFKFI